MGVFSQQPNYSINNQVNAEFSGQTYSKVAKQKAIDYYVEHDVRMQYKTYRQQGLLIGSGSIEAAHRSVIQQHMKLSGQKWSVHCAQAIANLRCYKHSGAWSLIQNLIAAAALLCILLYTQWLPQ